MNTVVYPAGTRVIHPDGTYVNCPADTRVTYPDRRAWSAYLRRARDRRYRENNAARISARRKELRELKHADAQG
jgi:hypothetical protein